MDDRLFGLFDGERLFVDDLVTAVGERGKSYGKELLRRLDRRAGQEGLARIHLDSRITAKGFYEKLGFRFHTSVPCWIEVEELLGGP